MRAMQVAIRISRKETNFGGWFNYIWATVHRSEIHRYCYLQFVTFDSFEWYQNESRLFIVWLIDYVTSILILKHRWEWRNWKCNAEMHNADEEDVSILIYLTLKFILTAASNLLINLIQMYWYKYFLLRVHVGQIRPSCISAFDRYFWYSWNTLFE